MHKTVFLLDGPIGVGKTTLGRLAAEELGFGFVDRDDLSIPGPWLRSILRTSRKTVEACATSIRIHEGVIVAGPVRCIEWRFFLTSFHRMEIACHCIGLIASSDVIEARERKLNAGELDRSREMIRQGYGQRPFSIASIRTDESEFEITGKRLIEQIRMVSGG